MANTFKRANGRSLATIVGSKCTFPLLKWPGFGAFIRLSHKNRPHSGYQPICGTALRAISPFVEIGLVVGIDPAWLCPTHQTHYVSVTFSMGSQMITSDLTIWKLFSYIIFMYRAGHTNAMSRKEYFLLATQAGLSGHTTFKQRRINVDATAWRCIEVDTTLPRTDFQVILAC